VRVRTGVREQAAPARGEEAPRQTDRRRRRAWRASDGQTTVEWLMIAGLLTAMGVVLLGIVPSTVRTYALALVYSVRTIAP
jgi:hypothetical protein